MRTFLFLLAFSSAMASPTFLYIGTATEQGGRGLFVAPFDTETGRIGEPVVAAATVKPEFLTVHPDQSHLYAIGDTGRGGTEAGCIVAFRINPADGRLDEIGRQPTGTANLVHLQITRDGRHIATASYRGATATVLPVNADATPGPPGEIHEFTGSSIHPERQKRAFPHSVNLSPDDRFLFVCDLGADAIVRFRLDGDSGTLARLDPPVRTAAGAGPRHLRFHPNGRWVYVINELNGTITAYDYAAESGGFTELHSVPTLPDGYTGKNTTAEVRVHPNGRFLYGSNRGHDEQRLDSIVVYSIDPGSGRLAFIERVPVGHHPRNFSIDPTGRWLVVAPRESDRLEVLAIDADTGRLTPHGDPVHVVQPMNMKFVQPQPAKN